MAKQTFKKNINKKFNTNTKQEKQAVVITEITYKDGITVGDLAEKINKSAGEIIKLLFMLSKMVTINTALDRENVELICMEYGITPTMIEENQEELLMDDQVDDEASLKERAPIVTIMGHVDHGKTTLLDTIRKTSVVSGEFGGITQHIGAYQVSVNGKKVTFLDTPGHEAFTAMRKRGAKVTDLTIIVVAADDGVMPQTKEAIDHSKAAGVPIIVAINKIDKPGANFDRIQSELSDLGLMPEEWGGDTIFTKCSAKTGEGVNELLETILVLAEVKELKANANKLATGTVIEAKLDKGRGTVVTLLVQNGTLKQGDSLVAGSVFGKVRRMSDDKGQDIKVALPSQPVEVIGLTDLPVAGDNFKVFENEKDARNLAQHLTTQKIEKERNQSASSSLEDLKAQIEAGEIKEVPVIVKTDVQGTAEAVAQALSKIEVEGVKVNVIRSQAGAISESDVMLASVSKAVIYGFNVRPDSNVRKKAAEEKVDIRLHNIIYKAVEEMEQAMKGMLDPEFEEVVYGQAEVRKIYKAAKIGTIAGSMVVDGKIVRDSSVRLIRDGIIVYEGKLASLYRFENEAKEVVSGFECGMTIKNFNDIKEGDIIESYGEKEVARN